MKAELAAVSALLNRVVDIVAIKAGELPEGMPGKVIGIKAQVDRLIDGL